MQTLDIAAHLGRELQTVGIYEMPTYKDGVTPRRLPDWTQSQVPALMDVVVRMPSGGRLRFATDATSIGVGFHATNLVTPPASRRPISFALESDAGITTLDSTAGNTIILNPQNPADVSMERGKDDTLIFDNLPGEMTTFELWLPHNAFLQLNTLQLNDGAQLHAPAADTRQHWIHYGSSISHCMEAESPAFVWPAVAARKTGLRLTNLGFGGQCHLDQFVARTIRDTPADLISIKTGINVINMDSMRERVFAPALHGFLDTIREGQPDTPIVLISAIFCPSAEDHPGPTRPTGTGKFVTLPGHEEIRDGCMTLNRSRQIIEEVMQQRIQAGDNQLHYLHGHELFSEADAADLPDDLHPNAEGYIRMGERFAVKTLKGLAKASADN